MKDNNGAITYTEQSYADERATVSIKSALIGNNAGKYVGPSAAAPGAFYAPLAGALKTKALAQAAKVGNG